MHIHTLADRMLQAIYYKCVQGMLSTLDSLWAANNVPIRTFFCAYNASLPS